MELTVLLKLNEDSAMLLKSFVESVGRVAGLPSIGQAESISVVTLEAPAVEVEPPTKSEAKPPAKSEGITEAMMQQIRKSLTTQEQKVKALAVLKTMGFERMADLPAGRFSEFLVELGIAS